MNFFSQKPFEQAFFIRSNISPEAVDFLCKDIQTVSQGTARAAQVLVEEGGSAVAPQIRQNTISDVPLSFWGSLIMQGAVVAANQRHFNYELTDWTDYIQFLEYKEGDHYKTWHTDQTYGALTGELRKLTVILGLSNPEDYEGGEFCYYIDGGHSNRFKLQKGEIAVFPSALKHRVCRVKSGVRKTLIGWYGGPPFK